MKKLIFLLFAFLCVSSLNPAKVHAQYEQLTKDYCGNVNVASYTYGGNDVVTIGKINEPQDGDIDVKITGVKVSGGGGSTSFSVDKLFNATTISGGGANFIVPGMGNFFKSQTQNATGNTNFEVKTTQTVTYKEGNPNDISKPFKTYEQSCESARTVAVIVPQQIQQQGQGQNQPNPNPQQGQPQGNPQNQNPVNVLCTSSAGVRGVDTAIGCIPIEGTQNTVVWVLRWAIGIAGGIAFLLILWSAIQIMTASGDPQKLNAGREVLTAAISGLVFVVFSVFLLRLIGINILDLAGFGF